LAAISRLSQGLWRSTDYEAMNEIGVRTDLHVHSSFSGSQTSWFLKTAGINESYVTPKQVYEVATRRGMNLVTICDHDEIAGALEMCAIASNTFISEEISARFPEDGCVVHLMALAIDEAQHREIQRLRPNIYELAAYLEQEQIGHFLCHPLAPVNRRLDESHLKRCFMMFRNVEVRNGTRDTVVEQQARRIIDSLNPGRLESWAAEFPQTPFINKEALYALTGGSDDHGGLSATRAYTSFTGECSGPGLVAALRERRTQPAGDNATPEVLSHMVYGVIAGFLTSSGQLPKPGGAIAPNASAALTGTLVRAGQLIGSSGISVDFASLAREGHTQESHDKLHGLLEHVLVNSSRQALSTIKAALQSANLMGAADGVSEVLKSVLLGAPEMLSIRSFAFDRRSARSLAARLAGVDSGERPLRIAVLSDTIDETNGVAIGLRRLLTQARAAGLDGHLVGLGDGDHVECDADGVVRIPAVLRHRLKDYPQINFGVPHLPSLLHHLVTKDFDLVQCSTPGPVGLAGMAAARIAGIPVIGQYHTDLPVYVSRLTGDALLSDLTATWVSWFYRTLDRVLAPSGATMSRLGELGVPLDRVRLIPRGIDLDLFTPARRDEHAFESLGLGSEPKILYVGRISREKGLDVLVKAFAWVAQMLPTVKLLLVGAGPYAEELAGISPDRVIFAGERTGEELARLYASSDVFAFPSETETFGNAVVEAQAAGLPVVVPNRGAAKESVVPGVTGLVVDAQDPMAIGRALHTLLAHPRRRAEMSQAAAKHARKFDMRQAVAGTFGIYRSFLEDSALALALSA
jgi:glycosyltransferase involved in cell wall biosynthesis/predicted metal-dependent phosphoesterase TrpH